MAQTAATSASAASAGAAEEFKIPPGYKKRMNGGQAVYCTKVVVLGSRFPKDDCRTQAELEDLEAQRESMRGEMQQRNAVCSGAAGCANQ